MSETHRSRVVLLGTAGGPRIQGAQRFGVSTAFVYGDDVYLVDLGAGSPMRLISAGLAGGAAVPATLERVRGIFFTHLHSDHTVEWPHLFATGAINRDRRASGPIRVFGPGDRGSLPRVFPTHRPEPEMVSPADPTPGIRGMTGHLRNAFATDFNDRIRDTNMPDPRELFRIEDVHIDWQVDADGIPPRLSEPITVWRDGDVKVTATLVDHRPTAPAFAFRFDTPDGSAVISGDTCVSQNLIDLARGVDVLVHEVIDPQFVDQIVRDMEPDHAAAIREHLLSSHTTIEQVGRDVAEPAGVKTLVLNHLVPADNPTERWQEAARGFSGQLIVGEDLMSIGVGPAISSRREAS